MALYEILAVTSVPGSSSEVLTTIASKGDKRAANKLAASFARSLGAKVYVNHDGGAVAAYRAHTGKRVTL